MVCVSPAAAPLESISPLLAAQIISAHPKAVSLSRLWAVQTSTHSCLTLSNPCSRNCRNPRACLICPNTGSTRTEGAASVSRLGMTYIHIPVDFQNPTDDDFDQFCAVMEQLKEVPVHVHCIANYRVSAFFYRYRRDVLGVGDSHGACRHGADLAPGGRLGDVYPSLG